jgi:uncharacterized protein (TIGR03435 family)
MGKHMLQTLLSDRFQLKIHRDVREMPVYVMTVAVGGLKMKPRSEADSGQSSTVPACLAGSTSTCPGGPTQASFGGAATRCRAAPTIPIFLPL